ncbi:MAG: hypothetical protein V1740_04180 [Candidatus Woesearchaeota archaeon]
MENDWVLYGEWNDIPVLALDTWNGYYNNTVLKDLLGDFLRILTFWKDNKSEIMFISISSEEKLAQLAKKEFLADPKHFEKVLKEYRKNRIPNMKRIEEIETFPLNNLSNKELIDLFIETRKIIGYGGAYDWYSFSFENKILEVVDLREYLGKNPEQNDKALSLTSPDEILPTMAEEIEVLQLALEAKGLSKKQIEDKFSPQLKEIANKFGWEPIFDYLSE